MHTGGKKRNYTLKEKKLLKRKGQNRNRTIYVLFFLYTSKLVTHICTHIVFFLMLFCTNERIILLFSLPHNKYTTLKKKKKKERRSQMKK